MEEKIDESGKRTKQAAAEGNLQNPGWSSAKIDALKRCKLALEQQVTVCHLDPEKRSCGYTDASEIIWSDIVAEALSPDLPKACSKQEHAPLAFLSGHLSGSELGGSTVEKEDYVINATIDRTHGLLATPDGLDLFTDQHNLIFFRFFGRGPNPFSNDFTLGSTLGGLLECHRYTYVHSKGVNNVWAALFDRWSAPRIIRRLAVISGVLSTSSGNFNWPSLDKTIQRQDASANFRPQDLELCGTL